MQSIGVKLFDTPQIVSDSYCQSEWSTAGTCCDVTTVPDAIKSTNNNIIGKWRSYINQLARIRKQLINNIKKIVKAMDVKKMQKELEKLTKNPKAKGHFGEASMLVPLTPDQIAKVQAWADNFDKNVDNFKTQGKVCFDALKQARSNLFCAMCSGNSEQYIDPDQTDQDETNVKVTQDACSTLVTACFPIWEFNFYLTSTFESLNVMKHGKKPDNGVDNYNNNIKLTLTKSNLLRAAFDMCDYNPTSQKIECTVNGQTIDPTSQISTLCNIALVVSDNNNLLEGDADVAGQISEGDVKGIEEDPELKSSRVISGRRLQSATVIVGVTASSSSSAYTGMMSTDSGLVPQESVDTNVPNHGLAIAVLLGAISALFALLL